MLDTQESPGNRIPSQKTLCEDHGLVWAAKRPRQESWAERRNQSLVASEVPTCQKHTLKINILHGNYNF